MWLVIGKIVAPHGLHGEVRVYPNSDFPERFLDPGQRWLRSPSFPTPKPIQLVQGRFLHGKGLYVIKFADIQHRDQAEKLRNCELLVPEGDRLPLEADEYHVADLIGLRVFDQHQQAEIGVVVDVFSAGNDLLEVELTSAIKPRRVLVPFVEAIVPVVDIEAGRVEIKPPAGLLDV
ncbi:MAG: ribosome maturation factor RimM [Cyanobacteria bacterium P01_A01_bin.123]